MKRNITFIVLLFLSVSLFALPKVHVIATGGTIAGTLSGSGYTSGQVAIKDILATVPELSCYADLDYEQFCNIGSQDMNERVWISLAKRVNEIQTSGVYHAIIITHGTDTMEETAFFLNLTTHNTTPIILVGAMRAPDSPEADGPSNLLRAVKTAVDPSSIGKEVMCCLGDSIFYAGSVFKNNSRAIKALASVTPGYKMPYNVNTCFDISNVRALPKVGIIYGYGGCSTLPLQSFIDAKYDGVVLAGVGDGNISSDVMALAEKAVKKGMKIVRSTRCPYGGVYTEGGEVEDKKIGFIPSGSLNPQKSRILLMLALTKTNDTEIIRRYFSNAITQAISASRSSIGFGGSKSGNP